MWDKPQALLLLANFLYALAAVLALYAALFVAVHLPLFPLREISVGGALGHVTRAQVEEVVKRDLRGNFFTLDLAAARTAFEKLPWVRAVSMRRKWPDRLEIALEEHVPLARWESGGLVNTAGEVYAAEADRALPLFSGPAGSAGEMAGQYADFRRQLAAIGQAPAQLRLSPRRAWRIRLENGLTLELGREQAGQRLARFVAVYGQTLGRMAEPPEYADLRYPNGFALRLAQAGKG